MKPSSPSQANQDADDAKTYEELYQRCTDLVSSWPSRPGLSYLQLFRHEKGWYNGVTLLVGTMVADELFAARPSDIVVATQPKSGTTWIKALLYATVHRREHPADAAGDHPFNSLGPHECIKFLEYQLYRADEAPDLDALPDPRLFATHAPFDLLPRAVVAAPSSGCRVVYVCRDPKDTLVSLLHFVNKYNARNGRELVAVDAAVGFFCDGVSPFGPYWEHVLGYWRAHRQRPERVLFFRYEEMKRDPAGHVRRLAEFAGFLFTSPEEDGGAVDATVRLCSFDNMVGLEATKGGSTQLTTTTVPNSAFFRRGEVGDWANHVSPEMAQRIDAITEAKFAEKSREVGKRSTRRQARLQVAAAAVPPFGRMICSMASSSLLPAEWAEASSPHKPRSMTVLNLAFLPGPPSDVVRVLAASSSPITHGRRSTSPPSPDLSPARIGGDDVMVVKERFSNLE
uniref:Sulfotransferase n=1 Tax=Oryza meridionalis TaxID=40149 RepID=A0A0E0C8Y1_9ORYZ